MSNDNTINMNRRVNQQEIQKGTKNIILIIVGIIVLAILVSSATFTVNEYQQAVVKRFGKVKRIVVAPDNYFIEEYPETMNSGDSILNDVIVNYGKGLFFKVPFIDSVEQYDSWLNTYVSNAESVNTLDKKQYYITMYAQWRISNPGLFAVTQKSKITASIYLDNLIFPAIIQNVNKTRSTDFINNKDLWNTSMQEAQTLINKTLKDSGIEILDMQVHRTILPNANLQSTYDKMNANREKIAQQARSEGEAYYAKQVSSADRQSREILAGAIQESEEIIGAGEAEALEIYANAYSVDEDFYSFWRSLEALETSLKSNTTLVLDTNHPLWSELLSMATTDPTQSLDIGTPPVVITTTE